MNAVIGWILLLAEAVVVSGCVYCAIAVPNEQAWFFALATFNTFVFAIVAITLFRRP